ncbi:MAG: TIGR01777 family oxidoreductase [Bacteroidota bacterium]|nr:TIGR01777 family oxidoreductase [Bacteroidota bacterium]
MATYIIAGGSGLIGGRLVKKLNTLGHQVKILSHSKEKLTSKTNTLTSFYFWDPDKETISDNLFLNADYVINLAGANVNAKWTKDYKKELLDSRVDTTRLLVKKLNEENTSIKAFINSSAIGYYGSKSKVVLDENSPAGDGFLAEICVKWEQEVEKLHAVPYYIVRTGIVLSTQGGALKEFNNLMNMNLAAPFGNGEQHVSWIHIDDLVNLYLFLCNENISTGIYNAVSENWTANWNDILRILAELRGKRMLLPGIPEFVIKLMFGERSEIVLTDLMIDSAKIKSSGFKYEYPDLKAAIQDLLNKDI